MPIEDKIEENSQWILPEKLKQQELQERQQSVGSSNLRGDFGSYKALLNNQKDTMIEYHNSVGVNARVMAKYLKKYIVKYYGMPNLIADMGCGAGFIAHELKEILPESKICAFDISQDAISYGRAHFKNVDFTVKQIEPQSDFGFQFDVIYAHEFYPFTRTNAFEFQKAYISNFLHRIRDDGILLISLAQSAQCLLNNYPRLLETYGKEFEIIKTALPIRKVTTLIRNIDLSLAVSFLINLILRRKPSFMIVIKKRK